MTIYEKVEVQLSDSQKKKLKRAIDNNRELTLRFSQSNFAGEGGSEILFTQSQFNKLNNVINTGSSVDIKFSKTQLNKLKSGGFLGSLLGGLAASVIPGLLGIGKGMRHEGSSVFLGKPSKGSGLWLRMNEPKSDKIYMKSGNKMYDISDVKVKRGSGLA